MCLNSMDCTVLGDDQHCWVDTQGRIWAIHPYKGGRLDATMKPMSGWEQVHGQHKSHPVALESDCIMAKFESHWETGEERE